MYEMYCSIMLTILHIKSCQTISFNLQIVVCLHCSCEWMISLTFGILEVSFNETTGDRTMTSSRTQCSTNRMLRSSSRQCAHFVQDDAGPSAWHCSCNNTETHCLMKIRTSSRNTGSWIFAWKHSTLPISVAKTLSVHTVINMKTTQSSQNVFSRWSIPQPSRRALSPSYNVLSLLGLLSKIHQEWCHFKFSLNGTVSGHGEWSHLISVIRRYLVLGPWQLRKNSSPHSMNCWFLEPFSQDFMIFWHFSFFPSKKYISMAALSCRNNYCEKPCWPVYLGFDLQCPCYKRFNQSWHTTWTCKF